jgi:Zinc dependent phospholipase C
MVLLAFASVPARAWDARTHRAIAHLAIEALPPSPLKTLFVSNDARLQYFAVEPDRLRDISGDRAEEVRHFINLEYYGSDPFKVIDPDRAAMGKRFGAATLQRAGTLPWTIEEFSDSLGAAWKRGDCAEVIRLAGFLAHYIGDASQPLHSTINYDGYTSYDRGVHRRVEGAVDYHIAELAESARSDVRVENLSAVWPGAIAEIRDANSHVGELISADRSAKSQGRRKAAYDRALFAQSRPMIVGQIARAASFLASAWLFEWKQSGSPTACMPHPESATAPTHP